MGYDSPIPPINNYKIKFPLHNYLTRAISYLLLNYLTTKITAYTNRLLPINQLFSPSIHGYSFPYRWDGSQH